MLRLLTRHIRPGQTKISVTEMNKRASPIAKAQRKLMSVATTKPVGQLTEDESETLVKGDLNQNEAKVPRKRKKKSKSKVIQQFIQSYWQLIVTGLAAALMGAIGYFAWEAKVDIGVAKTDIENQSDNIDDHTKRIDDIQQQIRTIDDRQRLDRIDIEVLKVNSERDVHK